MVIEFLLCYYFGRRVAWKEEEKENLQVVEDLGGVVE